MKPRLRLFIVIFLIGAMFSFAPGNHPPQSAQASSLEDGWKLYLPLVMKSAPPPPPGPDWLNYLNGLRALGDLPYLAENTGWSSGCWLHSRYMVKNNVIQHNEDPGNPWYSPEGDAAAGNSDLYVSSSAAATDRAAIDAWMTGPFHGVGILDPQLVQTGLGSYRESDGGYQMGACLNVLSGFGSYTGSFPLQWPKDGSVAPYHSYGGYETPDPLSSCPGYSPPSGPAIYLMIGAGSQTPNVTAHSFTKDGAPLAHCIFDETNYSNPDLGYQSLGRNILGARDAIILMPRNPLTVGATYGVSITTNGQTHTWSFTVSAGAQLIEDLLGELIE